MPVFIDCPSGHRLKVPKKLAGHTIICPVCSANIDVPPLPAPPRPLLRPMEHKQRESKPSLERTRQEEAPEEFAPFGRSHIPSTLPDEALTDESQTTDQFDDLEETVEEPIPSHGNPIIIHVVREPAAKSKSERTHSPTSGVLALGASAILVATICAVPSIIEQFMARSFSVNPPDTWSYFVLLGAIIQIAVASYAMCLPDWATSYLASVCSTAFAGMYALGLALTIYADENHPILEGLGLLDEVFYRRAQPWCFFITCVSLILAFFYGRFSARWHQLEKMRAGALRLDDVYDG